ncbi:MAG: hypothetical protein Q7U28_05695 [Aquabacterium sp.]|nr:hypothetical protein [Aquabacterium sp.]
MATTAWAGTTISTSVSDSISTAVGSVSGSIKKLSESSSSKDKVAAGDYKVIDVATVADRPGMARLTLQAMGDTKSDGDFFLYLPQKTVDANHVTAGGVVEARVRPYGVEFAIGEVRQAFFLVLEDDWYRELSTRPVVL